MHIALPFSDDITAERMGLYQAVIYAETMNLGKVISETDSEVLVKAILSQKFSRLQRYSSYLLSNFS